MHNRLLAIGGLLGAAALVARDSARPVTQEYHVQVVGHFDCKDNGVLRPLASAHVEIMDSDNDAGTFGDDLMGMTDTDVNGDFSSDGIGGDGGSWSWSKPDVYAQVLLDDQWGLHIRMKDDNDNTESRATPQHDHDNVEGTVNVGSMWWGSEASTDEHNATAPCIWLRSRQAAMQYANQTHQELPEGRYEIHYWAGVYPTPGITPFTTLATTHWPRHYSMYDGETNTHEFYHALRHGLDGDQQHFDWDDTRFRYGRPHEYCDSKHVGETHYNREGYAFNEGWALFGGISIFFDPWRCKPGEPIDMTLEGDVAFLLGQLEHAVATQLTATGSPRQAREVMLSVLRDNPESIHTFDEYCQAVQAAVPGSCGPAPMPLSVVPRARVSRAYSTVSARRMVQAEMAAQVDTARSLTSRFRAARAAAAEARPGCSGEDCQARATLLARPALLQREILVHQLVVRRLSAMLAESPARYASLAAFERRSNADAAEFQRQLRRINLAALDQVVKSLTPLELRSPVARPLVDKWRRKIEVRRRGPVPASDQARFYVMAEPSAMSARELRNPPVVKPPLRRAGAALVPRFVGCYALDPGDGHRYRLQLTDTPVGQSWRALSVGPGRANAPGNEWHWAPLDSTRFTLDWGGIDSAMEFTVTHLASGYSATGQRQWSSGPEPGTAKLHPAVRRIECPARAG